MTDALVNDGFLGGENKIYDDNNNVNVSDVKKWCDMCCVMCSTNLLPEVFLSCQMLNTNSCSKI